MRGPFSVLGVGDDALVRGFFLGLLEDEASFVCVLLLGLLEFFVMLVLGWGTETRQNILQKCDSLLIYAKSISNLQ